MILGLSILWKAVVETVVPSTYRSSPVFKKQVYTIEKTKQGKRELRNIILKCKPTNYLKEENSTLLLKL